MPFDVAGTLVDTPYPRAGCWAEALPQPGHGVTCGRTGEPELRDAGAVDVWRDPGELFAHFAGGALDALV